jgi:hypothetical protein
LLFSVQSVRILTCQQEWSLDRMKKKRPSSLQEISDIEWWMEAKRYSWALVRLGEDKSAED